MNKFGRLNEFFKTKKIECELLQTLRESNNEKEKIALTNYPTIYQMRRKLTKWQKNLPKKFIAKIENKYQIKFDSIIKNPPSTVFKPTKATSITDLCTCKLSDIVENRIKNLGSHCNELIELFEIEKANYLNGKRKDQLTEWWLSTINMHCELFLTERKFDFHAVPEDYISEAPSDLAAVRNNLKIIESILKPSPDTSNDERDAVLSFIEKLCKEIYIRINQFVLNVYAVVQVILWGYDSRCKFTIEDAENLLLLIKPKEESLYTCLYNLIQDVKYLLEMQDMENKKKNPGENQGGGLVLSNVVPVSGLILSTFFRRENILRTVLELYDCKPTPTQPQAVPNSSPSPSASPSPSPSSIANSPPI